MNEGTLTSLLPPPIAGASYGSKLTDVGFWQNHVIGAVSLALPDKETHLVAACFPGTYPTFFAHLRAIQGGGAESSAPVLMNSSSNCPSVVVVKLYHPLFFNGAETCFVECVLLRVLQENGFWWAPRLLASSDSKAICKVVSRSMPRPDALPQKLSFVVMQKVEGKCIRHLYESDPEVRLPSAFAANVGLAMRHLHSIPLDRVIALLPPRLLEFDAFIAERKHSVAANHRKWGRLPASLCSDDVMKQYFEGFSLGASSSWALLHADLTEDHVFVDDHLRITGIIDLGDMRVGSPFYELIALYLGLFRADKRLLKAFLDSYEWNARFRSLGLAYDNPRFRYAANSCVLLHEFNVLENPAVRELAGSCHSLKDLEELWNIVDL